MKKDNGTHRIRKGILAVFMNLILIIFSLSCIFPMIWMLYSSLKEKRAFNADIVGLPKNPTLINYIRILSNSDYHLGESMCTYNYAVYHFDCIIFIYCRLYFGKGPF